MKTDPIGLLIGYMAFYGFKKYKKPMRKMTVKAACNLLRIISKSKTAALEFKEEIEDIVAEAHYEAMTKQENGEADKENILDNLKAEFSDHEKR